MTTWPGSIRESFAHGMLVAWFLITRVQQFQASQPMSYSDSAGYLSKAGERVLSFDFFFGDGRLFTVPLLWAPWVPWYGEDGAILSRLHLALACGAWLLLGSAVASHARTPLGRITGRALVLVLACSSDVTQWDRALLSESISTSLFVGLVAAWLWWGHLIAHARSTRAATGTIIAVAVLWGFAREANGVFLLFLAAVALRLALIKQASKTNDLRRHGIAIAVALSAVFVLAQMAPQRGERWIFPMLNVIGRRVLPSNERTAYYAAAGMPLSPALMAMSGEFASGRDWSFYNSVALEDFRIWIRAHGRSTYLRDLAFHPTRTLSEPLVDAREFLCPNLTIYRPPGFAPALPDVGLGRLCSDGSARWLLAVALVTGVMVSAVGLIFSRRLSIETLFLGHTFALLMVAWPVLSWLTWHADAMEIARHVEGATLLFRLGCVLAIAWLVDLLAGSLAGVRSRGAGVSVVRGDPTTSQG